jgi:[protein-PII] uridylyltransferase
LTTLHALTVADARGTAPGVWTHWRAVLTADLIRRCLPDRTD